ncbi:MAG: hypothetical protein ACRYG2_30935, partial [Janthinobacterium lividum]
TASSADSSSSTSTDPTSTIASDLQSVYKDMQAGRAHGHHHGGPPPGASSSDDSQSTSSDGSSSSQTAQSTTTTSSSDPFQEMAASLLAYAKNQSLTATSAASTSLTA